MLILLFLLAAVVVVDVVVAVEFISTIVSTKYMTEREPQNNMKYHPY